VHTVQTLGGYFSALEEFVSGGVRRPLGLALGSVRWAVTVDDTLGPLGQVLDVRLGIIFIAGITWFCEQAIDNVACAAADWCEFSETVACHMFVDVIVAEAAEESESREHEQPFYTDGDNPRG
jgi:hypothetical protein